MSTLMKSIGIAVTSGTAFKEGVGRIKMRMKREKVARVLQVRYGLTELGALTTNNQSTWLYVSRKSDKVGATHADFTNLVRNGFGSEDAFAPVSLAALRVLDPVTPDVMTLFGMHTVDLKAPLEVVGDLTLVVTSNGVEAFSIWCEIQYVEETVGRRTLFKAGM